MKKEEIIKTALNNNGLDWSYVKMLELVWNAAIQAAVDNACIDGEWITNDFGNDICVCGTLDKESILKIKFKIDE